MAKQRFTEEFKQTIVDLYHAGSSVEQLASEYGMASQTIYKWIKLYTPNNASGVTEAEFLKLKKKWLNLRRTMAS
ncbi:transposase [Enterococcus sp. BWB1-3]|uniref:transposase n=1 Tax=Enterococcus sp. BWB1-3 TaxID=2787713 RepID=UPI00192237DD|nr:transposase [Enterococcus sp. BWB1-3]MBL1230952.1 transposase [Enterococcus sp. BWB1-3]